MFIARKQELKDLEQLYSSGAFECAVVYGRRRVGKTALINEFVRGKATVYFTGQETRAQDNLVMLSRSIGEVLFALGGEALPVFADFYTALEAVFVYAKSKRLVLVIDEFPYLAQSYSGVSSILQTLIDKYRATSKLMIILCGSSLSFMEHQVLGYQSPLFGRRTAQFKIEPFDFAQTLEYFRNSRFSAEDVAVIYAATGGIPLYMSLFDGKLPLVQNLLNNFCRSTAYLFEEPGNLIKQECRDPARYNSVIHAVANGATRLSEIAGKAAMSVSECTQVIANLISIGIVRKEVPHGAGSGGRKTLYVLADSMFAFWFRFIATQTQLIQRGMGEVLWAEVEDELPAFMGPIFERICVQYLWHENLMRQTPFLFASAGRWWGSDPHLRTQTEIDIVASDAARTRAIVAECKWTNEPVGKGVVERLVERSRLLNYRGGYAYYLFAKSGFTAGARAYAASLGNTRLVTFKDIVKQLMAV